MKKNLLLLFAFTIAISQIFAQPNNIYQPNGATTNFGKVAADSLNYYVVNYPALTLVKIDKNNNATTLTTLTADPFQTMIWNNGKGIFPVSAGAPFKLFDGTNQIDINGGQLPMAGFTLGNVIILDYFHKGNTTYFRTNDKIYKTDYSSPSSIITLAVKQSATGVGILDMSHTSNSIIFQNIVSTASGVLRRIDLNTGVATTIDSLTVMNSFDKGIVFNDEYYYCTPISTSNVGNSKIYKISDNGIKSIFYTETSTNKYLRSIIGATPNGIIAVISDNTGANEYVSIKDGVSTSLNFGTFTNSFPSNGFAGGVTTNSLVYFTAADTIRSIAKDKALWVTDGTLIGTKKIKGGPATKFNTSGLSQILLGSVAFCNDDLYYEGKDGTAEGLIYVNGTTFSMQSYNDLPNPVTLRTTSSGILAILRTSNSSSTKAVYKINCGSSTGILETNSYHDDFEIFPNPCSSSITLKLPINHANSRLTIFTILGELVQTERIEGQITDLKLNLKPGIYILTIDSNGSKISKKIIVE